MQPRYAAKHIKDPVITVPYTITNKATVSKHTGLWP